MALEKYKVCPACGEHNAPSLLECRRCETDLTGVRVVDSASERLVKETPLKEAPETGELYRVCDCGEKNPPQARKCRACGEDISDIIPTRDEAEMCKSFRYRLTAVDDEYAVCLDKPVVVIGREAELSEYLVKKAYVSRQHARLSVVVDKVFIENLSRTNGTFLNNELISDAEPAALKDGDEISLGGKTIHGERQKEAAFFTFQVDK